MPPNHYVLQSLSTAKNFCKNKNLINGNTAIRKLILKLYVK